MSSKMTFDKILELAEGLTKTDLIRLTLNLQESVDQIKQDNPVAFHSAIYYIKNREEVIKKVIKYNNSKKNKN